jgi:hypothetical protein
MEVTGFIALTFSATNAASLHDHENAPNQTRTAGPGERAGTLTPPRKSVPLVRALKSLLRLATQLNQRRTEVLAVGLPLTAIAAGSGAPERMLGLVGDAVVNDGKSFGHEFAGDG